MKWSMVNLGIYRKMRIGDRLWCGVMCDDRYRS